MLAVFVGAGILGIIIAVMEDGEFPGWWPMIGCVLAASLPAIVVNLFLPPKLSIIGFLVGAAVGAIAISALCGMSVKRAGIATGIYFVIQTALGYLFYG